MTLKKRKVPIGKIVTMTDEEIDEFTEVTKADIERLRAAWKKYASPKFRNLIDAELEDKALDAISETI